jgi:hypothetical protein
MHHYSHKSWLCICTRLYASPVTCVAHDQAYGCVKVYSFAKGRAPYIGGIRIGNNDTSTLYADITCKVGPRIWLASFSSHIAQKACVTSASPLDAVTIPRVVTPATGALSASRLVFEGRVGVPAI